MEVHRNKMNWDWAWTVRRRRAKTRTLAEDKVGLEQGRSYQSHWGHRAQNGVESPEAEAPGKGVALGALGGC